MKGLCRGDRNVVGGNMKHVSFSLHQRHVFIIVIQQYLPSRIANIIQNHANITSYIYLTNDLDIHAWQILIYS